MSLWGSRRHTRVVSWHNLAHTKLRSVWSRSVNGVSTTRPYKAKPGVRERRETAAWRLLVDTARGCGQGQIASEDFMKAMTLIAAPAVLVATTLAGVASADSVPINSHPKRHTTRIGQHRPLYAEFPAVGRVSPRFVPPPRAPWSSLRPSIAMTNRCQRARRTDADRLARTCERLPPAPIVETCRVPCLAGHRSAVARATDIRFAERTESLQMLAGDSSVDARCDDVAGSASKPATGPPREPRARRTPEAHPPPSRLASVMHRRGHKLLRRANFPPFRTGSKRLRARRPRQRPGR